jgi:hypothetical protein
MATSPDVSAAVPQHLQGVSAGPSSDSSSFYGVPQARLNVSNDNWGVDIWRNLRAQRNRPREHPSVHWCTSKDYVRKRSVAVPPRLPYFDASSWSFVPEMDPNTLQWKKCHLLSLPKELRLEIWRQVLTDSSVPKVAVELTRAPLSPGKTSLRFPNPCIKTTIQPPRKTPINIDILATNHFIYNEALPVLYHSLQLAPLDLEGIFDPFLKTISPFAQSHIRYIKLRIPEAIYAPQLFGNQSKSTYLVNWAITCAQVAKVHDVREVEIEGYPLDPIPDRFKNGILNPLCKIKAKKVFIADVDDEAQMALAEAERALQGQAQIRRQRTMSEAAERAQRDELMTQQRLREEEARSRTYSLPVLPPVLMNTIDRDLSQIPGIRHFEQELHEHERSNSVFEHVLEDEVDLDTGEWEMVSLKSGACTPKAIKQIESDGDSDGESWTDTASTLVETRSLEN